jgi:thiamine pyrophosphokinase
VYYLEALDNRRAIIFANGEITNAAALSRILRPDDFLAAANGGSRHLAKLKLTPHLLVGDLDSLPLEARRFLDLPDLEIALHPVRKDETDLELALDWILQHGCRQIRIAGAVGGRMDHALGNLFLLTDPEFDDIDIRLDDGTVEAAVVRRKAEFAGTPGDLLSLLPLGSAATGVTTSGLEYPLDRETLLPYRTRGISNVFTGKTAGVSLTGGLLICIHTRRSTGDEGAFVD